MRLLFLKRVFYFLLESLRYFIYDVILYNSFGTEITMVRCEFRLSCQTSMKPRE